MNSDAKIDILCKLTTASVADVMDGKGVFASNIKPIGSVSKVVGRAFTASSPPGDMLTCYWALNEAPKGSVLVIDGGGYTEAAIWGSLMTYEAKVKELAGVIINGAVRDTMNIKVLDFPVFAIGSSPRDGTIRGLGELGTKITCSGACVQPWDYILGDDDGVVVIPAEHVDQVIGKASESTEMEERIIDDIKKGKSLYKLFGLDELILRKEREDASIINDLMRDMGI
ncbi:MAG TPA: RraA family protein [Candidatus Methanofastidiosa archaeon]|nr:RraA family protein [Candidatus Methanofastidiosa archaeon]